MSKEDDFFMESSEEVNFIVATPVGPEEISDATDHPSS